MPTLTITTTTAQAVRIAAAFGKQLGTMTPAVLDGDGIETTPATPRNATAAEIKQSVVQYIKQTVFNQERRELVEALNVPDLNPS